MNNKPSILIVDDEPLNLKLAAATLGDQYELHFARDGEDAIAYVQNERVSIILLDITMPGMNGLEVALELKKSEKTARIPILYLTGDNSEETIEKAFDAGAVDFISKPFRKKELLVRIKNRLETENLKKNLHDLLMKNEHLLGIINSHVPYVKTNLNGIITEISPSLCSMIQSSKDLVGKNINILKSGHTPQQLYKTLWDTIESGQTYSLEIENINFSGGTNWYKSTVIPDINHHGDVTGYIAFYTNIDDKVKYKAQSNTDYLTGLNNRQKFELDIHEEIYRAQRYHSPFSIIMADIDYFKLVNDTYGHDIGDSVLKEFSQLLMQNIRQADILARWGGEEFIILCSNTEINGAKALAETLRAKIQEYQFTTVGQKTASFGVTQYEKGTDLKSLFLNVDNALYKAKEEGRNRVVVL
jgi:diguanylate cyclase (GGDEF)-like protein/PAS domain S-box-containing protein